MPNGLPADSPAGEVKLSAVRARRADFVWFIFV
jgi:hypothetical protein